MAYVTWFASFIERHWNQESKNWCSSYSCISSRDVTHQDINKTKMSFMEKKKIMDGYTNLNVADILFVVFSFPFYSQAKPHIFFYSIFTTFDRNVSGISKMEALLGWCKLLWSLIVVDVFSLHSNMLPAATSDRRLRRRDFNINRGRHFHSIWSLRQSRCVGERKGDVGRETNSNQEALWSIYIFSGVR